MNKIYIVNMLTLKLRVDIQEYKPTE